MKKDSMKDKEIWMDKLKEKLENYSEPVSSSGWEQLEKELVPSSSAKRIIYPYRRWAVAVAAVVLVAVSSVSIYFLNTPVADEVRQATVPLLTSEPDLLPETGVADNKSARIEPAKPVRAIIALVRRSAERQGFEPSESSKNDINNDGLQEIEKETKKISVEKEEGTEDQDRGNGRQEEHPRSKQLSKPSRSDKLHIPSQAVSKKGKWSMGAAVGNAGGTTGNSLSENLAGGFPQRLNMAPNSADAFVKVPENQTILFQNGLPYLQNKNEVIDVKHHQPITVGLTVRKGLKKRFSIETGLMYTLLSSEVTVSGNDANIDQKLHYIGIPVRANWNFLEKNRFILYVSAGGQIEKCVYGKLGNEKLTVKPLQLSVIGAIGAQFNATKNVGIYVEPGVAYFFDDGSNVKTIRKENPFNFNMQAGIRFTY